MAMVALDGGQVSLEGLKGSVEEMLARLLSEPTDGALDPRWALARTAISAFAMRPAKRVRPMLLMAGHALGRGGVERSDDVVRFAAALELLHTFMLVHDDVADRATVRRGGPALHLQLGGGKHGEDLAVVAGDYLYARAIEAMLESSLPASTSAVRYLLGVCRQTAAGQHLDLALSRAPLPTVTLFQLLKVAQLKTAQYSVVAPLVCGAMLGGAPPSLRLSLERAGRQLGVAFQLRDDIAGLFGDDEGTPRGADFFEGKRTFPLISAWLRADAEGRARLEALWALEHKDEAALMAARREVMAHGGRAACERAIARGRRAAARALAKLPPAGGVRALLCALLECQLPHEVQRS